MPIYKLLFTEFAELEFADAYKYYEEQQKGLGKKFEMEYEEIIRHLVSNTYIFQRKFKH